MNPFIEKESIKNEIKLYVSQLKELHINIYIGITNRIDHLLEYPYFKFWKCSNYELAIYLQDYFQETLGMESINIDSLDTKTDIFLFCFVITAQQKWLLQSLSYQ
jgi:hypothetical protein